MAQLNIELKVLRPRIMAQFPGGGIPRVATSGSAGVDLYAALESPVTLGPGETAFIPTGIAVHMKDPGIAGLILSRSGLGTKQGLVVKQGVGLVDADYQGEITVALLNISAESRTLQPGDRIAQFVLTPVFQPQFQVVGEFSQATVRGVGGFGSTGITATV